MWRCIWSRKDLHVSGQGTPASPQKNTPLYNHTLSPGPSNCHASSLPPPFDPKPLQNQHSITEENFALSSWTDRSKVPPAPPNADGTRSLPGRDMVRLVAPDTPVVGPWPYPWPASPWRAKFGTYTWPNATPATTRPLPFLRFYRRNMSRPTLHENARGPTPKANPSPRPRLARNPRRNPWPLPVLATPDPRTLLPRTARPPRPDRREDFSPETRISPHFPEIRINFILLYYN